MKIEIDTTAIKIKFEIAIILIKNEKRDDNTACVN